MAANGSRKLWVLLAVVVVLAGLLVAADRIALVVSERIAARNIRDSQGLSSTPDISVAGFPFLSQLVSGSFDKITVVADDVPIARSDLDLTTVRVVLHGVHASDNFATVHTDHADATATVDYPQLSRALHVTVTYAGHGTIRTRKTVTVAGQSFTATVTTRPTLTRGALAFTSSTVDGLSSLGQAVAGTFANVFDLTVPLDSIPFDIRARSLAATPSGLSLSLTGSDLTYTKS